MSVKYGILNESGEAEEQFVLAECSGDPFDLPEPIQENMTLAEASDLEQGKWVLLNDGEVEVLGFSHPFLIMWEAEDND